MVAMRTTITRGRVIVALVLSTVMIAADAGATASAASEPRKKLRVKTPPAKPAPVYRWRPADPSFDQNGRPYRPPRGLPCPIDLGYGRWTSCLYR